MTTGAASGNGTANAVTFISGTTATKLLWPENSIPSTFTVCSVTRYTGGQRGRILTCMGSPDQPVNWLHGHAHGNYRGVAFYSWAEWVTPHTQSVGVLDDWLVMCGTNALATAPGNIILDQSMIGAGNGPASGGGGGQLNINYYNAESSDWALHSIFIWNYSLGAFPAPWHTRPCLSNLVAGSDDVALSMVRFRDAWNCCPRAG